jgi:hypothetical protein
MLLLADVNLSHRAGCVVCMSEQTARKLLPGACFVGHVDSVKTLASVAGIDLRSWCTSVRLLHSSDMCR